VADSDTRALVTRARPLAAEGPAHVGRQVAGASAVDASIESSAGLWSSAGGCHEPRGLIGA
jgi:hypothetical protein